MDIWLPDIVVVTRVEGVELNALMGEKFKVCFLTVISWSGLIFGIIFMRVYNSYFAVNGSIIAATSSTELAGKPPCLACSRTSSSLGAA